MAVASFRRVRGVVSRSSSFRLSLLMGTALALPTVAQAENVAFNGTGDYSLTRTDTVAGGPRTVDIATNGKITLDLAAVTVDNSVSNTGAGIAANAGNGAGDVSVRVGTLTATGTSSTFGVNANSNSGNIVINAGSVTSNGNASSRAISATTTSGNITINSTLASGGLRGIFTNANANVVTITSGTALANAVTQSNAIIGQGKTVNVTSDTASLTNTAGTNGAAIFVTAANVANIKSTTVATSGTNQAGIQVYTGGDTTIDSGSVTMAGNNPYGISVFGTKSTTIKSNLVKTTGANGGIGIYVSPDAGGAFGTQAVSITSDTIDMANANSTGIQVDQTDSAITVASTTIKAGTGINVLGNTADTKITSGTINAVSAGISSNTVSGNTTIVSGTITTTSAGATGIQAYGDATSGKVDITSGKITSNGTAIATTGGATTVKSTEITGGGSGINVYATGAASVDSGSITLATTRSTNANSLSGVGIAFVQTAAGDASIKSDSITYTGTGNTVGITAQHTGTAGTLKIDSRDVTVTGNGGYGILGYSQAAAVTINSTGALTTVGTTRFAGQVGTAPGTPRYADGIVATSGTGALTVNNSGTITTSGATARGIVAEAGTAATVFTTFTATSTAPISITNSGSITTTGATSSGIRVRADQGTAAVVNSGSVKTSGLSAAGIDIVGSVGAITVDSNSVVTTGVTASGVLVQSTAGNATVKTGTTTTSGAGSQGVFVQSTTGNISIDAGTTATTATAVSGNNTSDAVFGYASGNGSVTIKSVNASTKADFSNAIGAVGGGAISVTSGTASSAGQNISTIYAYNRTAAGTTVTADTTTATGNFSYAVEGDSVGGNVTIKSGSASATNGIGVYASAGGIADVTATTTTSGGDGQAAVYVTGGTGVKLNIGSAASTGALQRSTDVTRRADAVFAQAVNGTIDATIGSAKATGVGADAIHLVANGTGGAVKATITGTVSSTAANGVFIDPPGTVDLTIASTANVSGATAGVNVLSATQNTIVNAGTVSSTSGPAILASGKTSLDNSGKIVAGTGSAAVQLGASDDVVTLRTGSAVTGAIVGGGGVDKAVLNGTGVATSATQTVAAFSGFDSLSVAGGYWTAGSTASSFNNVNVARGATLEVATATTGGLTGVITSNYVADGTLAIRSTGTGSASVTGGQTVSGAGRVLFTGAGTATLSATNAIATTGGIAIDNGASLVLTGTQGGKVDILSGGTFSIGNGGTTGLFTGDVADNGTLIVNHSDDYSFTGALTGAGTLVKQGAGKLTLGTGYAFTGTTNILGGSIKLAGTVAPTTELDLTGTGTLDFSGTRQTVAELAGNSAQASISVAQGGALTVNQTTSTAFAGAITGDGALAKTGTGTLNLTGASTYTGATTVTGGKLAVNGSIVSPVTVTGGGKLGGNGRVGNVTIGAGGAYAPGNSIGLQTVAGNVTFASGSTYEVETNADGRADRINATGTATIATGTTVAVLPEAGTYARLTNYTILSATGGVSGTFTNVTSNFAFLTPSLAYTGTAVTLRLLRNDVTFASLAQTPNQLGVANAISAQGFSGAVFNAAIVLSNAATPDAYNQLTGELFAAVPSVLIDQSKRIRGAVLDRADVDGEGLGIWGQAMRAGIETDATSNVSATATDRKGVLSGIDYGHEAFRFGVHAGYVDSDVGVKGRASQADVHTKLVGAYGRWSQDALTVKVGGDYSWHSIKTTRSVTVPGLAATERSGYDATSQQVFGEVSYRLLNGPVTAAPFGGLAYVRTHSDQAVEAGSAAALTVASRTRDVKLATGGWHVGGSAPISPSATLLPHLTASFQYAWGDLRGGSISTFGGTGQAFGVSGARLAQATYGLDGGVDVAFDKAWRVGVGGFMSTSRDWSDFGANVSLSFAF